MSVPVRNPMWLAGATCRTSGDVQDAAIGVIRGGGRCAAILSGGYAPNLNSAPGATLAGGNSGHVLLFSGAGRLNSILPHVQMVSGVYGYFYDAGTLSFGTGLSGQKIIGVIPPTMNGGTLSGGGYGTYAPWNGEPIRPDMPFNSGLCVLALSGVPGFTVSWTPEANSNWSNNVGTNG